MDIASIRPATEDDLDALITLYREFHAFHVAGLPARLRLPEQDDTEDIRRSLGEILANADAALLVAEVEDRVIGLAEVYFRHDEPHPATVTLPYGYLQSLMVTERWRGHGVGERLLRAAEDWARGRGAVEMRLSAWEFPAGPLRFYEREGYVTIKRTMARPL